MNGRKRLLFILLAIFLLLPLWMWLWWFFTPKQPLTLCIIDKTVLQHPAQEHESLNWVLNYQKITKTNGDFYAVDKDYFGFFPGQDKAFTITDFEQYSNTAIAQLVAKTDVLYIADTYGIYRNEWYHDTLHNERSNKIYGGLSVKELQILKGFKQQKKLIVTEFNTIASPTPSNVRQEFETTFGLQWTGWVGRYFSSLDTTVYSELPAWVTRNYRKQHNNQWPFKNEGIVLVNESEVVEILEFGTHTTKPTPIIETSKKYQAVFGVPATMKYPFWFDIMYTSRKNEVAAVYTLSTTAKGDSLLNVYNLPKRFPAVIVHNQPDYRFYYLAGDFSDNPINSRLSYFKGIPWASSILYSHTTSERHSFFWDYYLPMVSTLLKN